MLPELKHSERAHWYGGYYKYITMLCDACYMAAVRTVPVVRDSLLRQQAGTSGVREVPVISPTTGLGHRLSRGNPDA